MTIYDWPASLAPRAGGFFRRGMTVAGAPSLTGLTQVGQADAGFWTARYDSVPLASPAIVRAYRALAARLEGGGNLVRVPVFDRVQTPWATPGVESTTPTDYTDGTDFTDGTAFYERTIRITLQAAVSRGVTQIVATIDNAGTIEGGEYFTLGERLHIIREVLSTSGSDQTWWIWPKLRQNYAAGLFLGFDAPACLMRQASEADGDLMLEFGSRGFPGMAFVEAFTAADLV